MSRRLRCRESSSIAMLALAGAAACGGSVSSDDGGGAGSGGDTGAAGAGPGCGRTEDSATFVLTIDDEHWRGCGMGHESTLGSLSFDAAVAEVQPLFVTLDRCPPNADCAPLLNELRIDAPGLALQVPVGAFVHVQLSVDYPGLQCVGQLIMSDLPEWNGTPNPVANAPPIWLALSDGLAAAPPDAPFRVDAEPLGCFPADEICGRRVDDYALAFVSGDDSASRLLVAMGQTARWALPGPGGPHALDVRNLRSFQTRSCDELWGWAYWLAPAAGR